MNELNEFIYFAIRFVVNETDLGNEFVPEIRYSLPTNTNSGNDSLDPLTEFSSGGRIRSPNSLLLTTNNEFGGRIVCSGSRACACVCVCVRVRVCVCVCVCVCVLCCVTQPVGRRMSRDPESPNQGLPACLPSGLRVARFSIALSSTSFVSSGLTQGSSLGTLRFKSSFAGSGLALGSDVGTLGLVSFSFRYLEVLTLRARSTPAAATQHGTECRFCDF